MRSLRFFTFILLFAPFIVTAQQTVPVFDPAYEGGPEAPIIRTTDFPDENIWYRSSDATFSWTLPPGTSAVAAEVSLNVTEPQEAYRPPISELSIPTSEWREGTQYLLVQFRNEEKWGMYAAYKVMIDDTPPEPFSIITMPYQGEGQSGITISFAANDTLSGVAYYTVSINGSEPIHITVPEARRGYFVPLSGMETQRLVVRAYDQAGNTRESSAVVLPVEPPTKNPAVDPLGFVADDPAPILLSVVTGLLFLMFGYLVYERQRYATALVDLREETDEIETQMFKVFAALREEIFDQIDAINRKTRLTKKEKEAIEGLTKALDVSEQLLEKEVKDVKKILK